MPDYQFRQAFQGATSVAPWFKTPVSLGGVTRFGRRDHYYYIFYTLGTPNVDRLSRFTANATLTGTVAGSEFVIYQDPEIANAEHHGGAINFSNDGKILVTTGENFNAAEAQDLTKPRGKILRYNMDGTIPTSQLPMVPSMQI